MTLNKNLTHFQRVRNFFYDINCLFMSAFTSTDFYSVVKCCVYRRGGSTCGEVIWGVNFITLDSCIIDMSVFSKTRLEREHHG